MNILNKIKLLWHNLFYGLSSADRLIQGQSLDNESKQMGIHQVKDVQRVSPALLKGEITQEVVDLRYRDYVVSEGSRLFLSDGTKNKNEKILDFVKQIPNKFSGINHEICNGIIDCEKNDNNYTLKVEYENSVRYLLEKHCDHFSVDGNNIYLYFNTTPNKNLVTSKAFCNYMIKLMANETQLGGEYSKIPKLWFTSYKISNVPNYTKFIFKDLTLCEILTNKTELILKYCAASKNIESVIDKYTSDELKKKYEIKSEKHLPQDSIAYDIKNKCEMCGREISYTEGKLNKAINGRFCCGDCLAKDLLEMEESL